MSKPYTKDQCIFILTITQGEDLDEIKDLDIKVLRNMVAYYQMTEKDYVLPVDEPATDVNYKKAA